MMTFCC